MPSFVSRLRDGWNRANHHLPLALVPLVTALLNTDKIGTVVAFEGGHVGARVGLPVGIVNMWQFVSVPNSGVNVSFDGPNVSVPVVFVVLPVLLVVQAGLAAGYFGSIRDAIAAEPYDFVTNVRRYLRPFLLYTMIPALFLLPLTLFGIGSGRAGLAPLIALLIPTYFILAYLFFAAPYLVVLRETGLVSAVRASYALALSSGSYFGFALGFAVFVLFSSVLATTFVVNSGLLGVVLGAIVAAPIGLAANFATMRFVADIDPKTQLRGSGIDRRDTTFGHDEF